MKVVDSTQKWETKCCCQWYQYWDT